MGKMRMINTDFWSDSWVVDNLNPLESYLFLYLISNPYTNLSGVYKLSKRIMSFQTGIDKDKLDGMLQRLQPKVFYVDGWIILTNAIKNQNYNNTKINTGILRELDDVPEHILQQVKWPKDFGSDKPKGTKQQDMFDESSRLIQDSSHLIITKLNNNADAIKDSAQPNQQPKKQDDLITKLYYEVVKSMSLPVRNHANLRKKITQLKAEAAEDDLIKYLTFMRDDWQSLKFDFKPEINEALDIYAKRKQIENSIKREIVSKSQSWVPK